MDETRKTVVRLRRLVCVGNNEMVEMVEMVAAVKESLCPIPHSTAWHSDHTCLTKKMEVKENTRRKN